MGGEGVHAMGQKKKKKKYIFANTRAREQEKGGYNDYPSVKRRGRERRAQYV